MTEAAHSLRVTLPDGKVLELPSGSTIRDVAFKIGPGLGKACLGGKLDGNKEILDLRYRLPGDCRIEIVTDKSPDGLEVIRHSASHIMADAITKLWPQVKLTIGPATDDGFYYDLDLDVRLTPEDLPKIEAEMAKVVAADTAFERCAIDRQEALKSFGAQGEIYKVELIEGFDPKDEISLYRHGNGAFQDLCRGPHVPSTGYVKAFKLLSIAGAYWRGDEKNKQLQRVYGTAFASPKDLDAYLKRMEEAKARDHRKLGRELGLFMMHPIAPASPFFLPRGTVIYNRLQQHMRELYREYGYQEVISPQVFDAELFKKSGHWDHYRENMFVTHLDERDFGVKPMNCPGHTYIFAAEKRSYRELPLRIADFGRLHRYERSGVTGGLTRVRTFCQDDAHIFATTDHIKGEIASLLKMIHGVYELFGFGAPKVYLSTRPASSLGSDELWAKAEKGLADALTENGVAYTVNKGDGAFYGPKIDFVVQDAIGRDWQLGTIQLDFNLPIRFDLKYTTKDDSEDRPVMIHRAILGSLERFIGILIEQCSGNFPFWLAPEQARVLTIGENHVAYGQELTAILRKAGFRVEIDASGERIGSKVREARLMRVPYLLTVGDREVAERKAAVRERPEKDLGAMSPEALLAFFAELERNKK
jgi:threonyl-tRNA synthetase